MLVLSVSSALNVHNGGHNLFTTAAVGNTGNRVTTIYCRKQRHRNNIKFLGWKEIHDRTNMFDVGNDELAIMIAIVSPRVQPGCRLPRTRRRHIDEARQRLVIKDDGRSTSLVIPGALLDLWGLVAARATFQMEHQ